MGDVVVERATTARMMPVATGKAVALRYIWTSADPLTVTLTGATVPTWLIGRDLLHAALYDQSGEAGGDIYAAPYGDNASILLELSSPHGRAGLRLPASDLSAFLDRTFTVTPIGQEVYDLDAGLRRILESGLQEGR